MSFENEQKLLAAVMIEPDYIDMLRNQGVRAELFESPTHRRIFEAAEKQYRVSGTVELTDLAGELGSSVTDPGAVLMEIQSAAASTAGIESWIRLFKADAAKAALVRAAEIVKAEPDAAKALDFWLKAESEAQEIMAGANTKTTRELAAEMIDQIQHSVNNCVPWFDEHTEAGIAIKHQRGDMYVIGCRPGQGKTALAAGVAKTNLLLGNRVLYLCTESSSIDIMARITAVFSGIPHYIVNDYGDRRLHDFARESARISKEYSDTLFIRGNETRINTPEKIRGEAKRIIAEYGRLDLIIIDFFQNLKAPAYMARQDRLSQLNYCTDELHAMFAELHAAGIVLAQLNRKEGVKVEPDLEHLKGTGYIGELAHAVFFMTRDRKTNRTALISNKERNMPHLECELIWNGTGYDSRQKYSPIAR